MLGENSDLNAETMDSFMDRRRHNELMVDMAGCSAGPDEPESIPVHCRGSWLLHLATLSSRARPKPIRVRDSCHMQ